MNDAQLKKLIRAIPDFPKKGIMFRDITPLLRDINALKAVASSMADYFADKGINVVAAAESRGFIFGSMVAERLNAGFIPIRKPGKLPHKTLREDFVLEYGSTTFEMHIDAIKQGEKVLIVDDVLATGGTAKAMSNLVRLAGGKVEGFAFLIELDFLRGREKISETDVFSIIHYLSEEEK